MQHFLHSFRKIEKALFFFLKTKLGPKATRWLLNQIQSLQLSISALEKKYNQSFERTKTTTVQAAAET